MQVSSPVAPISATERTPPKNAPLQIAIASASRATRTWRMLVVGRDALDQRRDPIVGQRGRELDAAPGQLAMNCLGHVHGSIDSNHGAAAITSTSTRNSGRENPETIISVDAGAGSEM